MSEKSAARTASFREEIPDGDDRSRMVCDHCGFVNYQNPKLVVGVVAHWKKSILLCRRAIEPRRGYWTLPAGYLELNESAADGALREAREEACAQIKLDQLLAVYSIPRISQIQLIYRAWLISADIAPGPESSEVFLFPWSDIPWSDLAFPSVRWALNHYREVQALTVFAPRGNPEGESGDLATFLASG